MPRLFTDNAGSTLASGIDAVTTTITLASGTGALFPSPTNGDFFDITLTQTGQETSWEQCICTARNSDILSIVRGANGTTAQAWGGGSKAELRITAKALNDLKNLSTTSGNLIKYDTTGLYITASDIGQYLGIESFENILQGQTYVSPVIESGDQLLLGGKTFKKIYIGNKRDQFIYLLRNLPLTIVPVPAISVTNLNNSSTSEKYLGSLKFPGDSVRWSKSLTVSVTVTADTSLNNCTMSMPLTTYRNINQYRIKKVTDSTNSGNVANPNVAILEFTITVVTASLIKVGATTTLNSAPTSYTNNYTSGMADLNTLGNVEFPIYLQFSGTAANPATINILSVNAKATLVPIDSMTNYDSTKTYRTAYLQPFPSNDITWNQPLLSGVVNGIETPVYTMDANTQSTAATRSLTTGTINASGIAGSDTITVFSTARVKVGMYVSYCSTNFANLSNIGYVPNLGSEAQANNTLLYFGYNVSVIAVLSATQLQLSAPVLTSFTFRGGDAFGGIVGLVFYSTPETIMVRSGNKNSNSLVVNPITGVTSTKSNAVNPATYRLTIRRISQSDPVTTWSIGDWVSFNGWLSNVNGAPLANGEAYNNMICYMRAPIDIPVDGGGDYDRNSCLITEDGKYSIDSYGTGPTSTTTNGVTTYNIRTYRSLVTDLNSTTHGYLLNRPEFSQGASNGTRAFGGSLFGGVVRKAELESVPTSFNVANGVITAVPETDAQIAANIAIAMNAIPHALAIVPDVTQQKSLYYKNSSGGLVAFKSYKSQFDKWRPSIVTGGSGYVVGEVLYVTSSSYYVPLRLTVTSVDVNGAVTGIFVTNTGSFVNIPVETSPGNGILATTSSVAGTGCTISVTTLPDTTITTIAQAFPTANLGNAFTFPAVSADGDWGSGTSGYTGIIPMGAIFTIDQNYDLVASWTSRRKNNPTAKNSTYELLALFAAVKKYGAFDCDTAYNTMHCAIFEKGTDIQKFRNATGDIFGNAYVSDNLAALKNSLIYVQNVSPQGKGTGGTYLAPLAPDLYPPAN